MNSALVKLLNNTGQFRLNSDDQKKVRFDSKDKACMLVNLGTVINMKDDMIIEDGIISANQTVLIKPDVTLVPHRYHALVSYNHLLPLSGLLVSPVAPIVRPTEQDKIALVVRASRKVDLNDFEHIFELYQLD